MDDGMFKEVSSESEMNIDEDEEGRLDKEEKSLETPPHKLTYKETVLYEGLDGAL